MKSNEKVQNQLKSIPNKQKHKRTRQTKDTKTTKTPRTARQTSQTNAKQHQKRKYKHLRAHTHMHTHSICSVKTAACIYQTHLIRTTTTKTTDDNQRTTHKSYTKEALQTYTVQNPKANTNNLAQHETDTRQQK